jgi:acetyltransferase-like isoleucine patch superfamily enzyme
MKITYSILLILICQTISIEEVRIDYREYAKDPSSMAMAIRDTQLNHKFNMALPFTDEWTSLMKELFYNQIGENSIVNNGLTVVLPKNVTIGSGVTVMNGALMMAAGGITIEDKVLIAANVKLITNNHDPYERDILTCRPILIKEGAWVGAGATILPGITVGKYAIVGSDSVVTKDIPSNSVAVGIPAKVIETIDEYYNKNKNKVIYTNNMNNEEKKIYILKNM